MPNKINNDSINLLYFGKIVDGSFYSKKEHAKTPFHIAQYLYEKALVERLCAIDSLNVEIVSIYQTKYFPKDVFYFNRKAQRGKVKWGYLSFINIPFARELSFFVSSCIFITKWHLKHLNCDRNIIFSSCHFTPVSLAAVILGKAFSLKKVVTFTDLSLFSFSKNKIKNMPWYKKAVAKKYLGLTNKLQISYDGYVLFSLPMNKIVNRSNKPYVHIEGIFNSNCLDPGNNYNNIKTNVLTYAGTLNREYGVDKILEIFYSLEEERNLELWFIGSGDMVGEIIDATKKNKQIKYFGFLHRSEVFEKLKKSTLLLNLRNPRNDFTAYSFPSKMFEYMVSGTPVLTTRLDGIPTEYYEYVFVAESTNSEDLKQKILTILHMDKTERTSFGRKAAKFIVKNKTSEQQVGKIYDLLSYLLK